MATFKIEGGRKLSGELVPQGAKNEALQILSAVLLTREKVIIHNIPDIIDVRNLIKLLEVIGVEVVDLGAGSWSFQADKLDTELLEGQEYRDMAMRLRGSVMLMGPLIARLGKAIMPQPGGDKIGRRRLDTHFNGFCKLGVEVKYDGPTTSFILKAGKMHGAEMLLEEASVTGTANLLMLAVLTPGKTTIFNAACEPYLQQLSKMLIRMGAKISGLGSNLLTIEGVDNLGGTSHTVMPDMIEIGSFIGLAAMTGSEITINPASVSDLGIIPRSFERLGIHIEDRNGSIHVPAHDHYKIETFMDGSIMSISDAPWPGLTPDLLSVFLVVATQAAGSVLIHQKMFESRLFFVDKLIDMGAQIILCDPHRATVIGLDHKYSFRATTMSSPDIRAGVALLIAAMSAEGTSVIHNVEQIDRGYQYIDTRLNAIGAKISRV